MRWNSFTVLLVFVLSLVGFSRVAPAQWEVIYLAPEESEYGAYGWNVFDDVQVGQLGDHFDSRHACLWTGTAASIVDLNPSGAGYSAAESIYSGQICGWAWFSGTIKAGTWTTSASSWVDLHPGSATESKALSTDGTYQVGYRTDDTNELEWRAGMWSGTSSSWTSLHPSSANRSMALGVHSGKQVGWASIDGARHAALWSGTSSSFVDLNPSGSSESEASDTYNASQVGYAKYFEEHAAIWYGSASLFVDLHPTSGSGSQALGVFDRYQVGFVSFASGPSAAFWNGCESTWHDLGQYVSEDGWHHTWAEDVWTDDDYIYVIGGGFNTASNRNEAILWYSPVPCLADFNGDGFVNGNDFDDFVAAWENNDCLGDFNRDCFINGADYDDFVAAWEANC